jgi:hypothetical protein
MSRFYRADKLHASLVELKKARNGFADASLFLPTTEDYKSPVDPDGTKGLRQWNEDHSPKGHSGRTRPGGRDMKVSF